MGNIISKNSLKYLIKSWEKEDPHGFYYKKYTNVKKAIVIHRLNGHYFVENNTATIGPMTKEQLLIISNNNSLEKIRTMYAIAISKKKIGMNSSGSSIQGDVFSEKLTINSNISLLSKLPYDDSFMKSLDGSINVSFKDNTLSKINVSQLTNKSNNITKRSTQTLLGDDLMREYDSKAYLKLKTSEETLKGENGDDDTSKMLPDQSVTYTAFGKDMLPYQNRCVNPNRPYVPINMNKLVKQKFKTQTKSSIVKEIFKSKLQTDKNLNNDNELSQKETIMESTLAKIDELPLHKNLTKNLRPTYDPKNIKRRNQPKVPAEKPAIGWNTTCNNTIGLSELIQNERYCFSALADFNNIEWCRIKSIVKRLQNGFTQRFNCTVVMSENQTTYRGIMYYMVRIEGPDLYSVIKCRNSLPATLRKSLIVTSTNPDNIEKKMADKLTDRRKHTTKPKFRELHKGDIRI